MPTEGWSSGKECSVPWCTGVQFAEPHLSHYYHTALSAHNQHQLHHCHYGRILEPQSRNQVPVMTIMEVLKKGSFLIVDL